MVHVCFPVAVFQQTSQTRNNQGSTWVKHWLHRFWDPEQWISDIWRETSSLYGRISEASSSHAKAWIDIQDSELLLVINQWLLEDYYYPHLLTASRLHGLVIVVAVALNISDISLLPFVASASGLHRAKKLQSQWPGSLGEHTVAVPSNDKTSRQLSRLRWFDHVFCWFSWNKQDPETPHFTQLHVFSWNFVL